MSYIELASKLLKGAVVSTVLGATAANADTVTLRGASMFDNDHAFTKTMLHFEELVDKYYDGEVAFDLRLNGELGVEKDYVTFLNQGVAIDYTM